ncbi:unnamed protein product [Ceratitis capitata]|uniref:(Mediterranean fruit fly) hypothetical protein n=1 Tax=Ceratitis capitata TaxID=7213 RepID=A0A811VBU5_CERCA|nr:unnamed protein product [Ceratitis capitata]
MADENVSSQEAKLQSHEDIQKGTYFIAKKLILHNDRLICRLVRNCVCSTSATLQMVVTATPPCGVVSNLTALEVGFTAPLSAPGSCFRIYDISRRGWRAIAAGMLLRFQLQLVFARITKWTEHKQQLANANNLSCSNNTCGVEGNIITLSAQPQPAQESSPTPDHTKT